MGPIQDDEALLLYAVCRVCCYSRVIEFGGLGGYSALNFLKALEPRKGTVYSVDCSEMGIVGERHIHVHKEAAQVTAEDFGGLSVDLALFDCHDCVQQLTALQTLKAGGIIAPSTLLVFHDTGLHANREHEGSVLLSTREGWIHQQAERKMVRILQEEGYDTVEFHCLYPTPPIRYRHGLTLMRPVR